MATQDIQLLAFNRGVVSKLGLARMDLERMAMSAEIQSNWMPRVLGSMMLRPGWEFIVRGSSDTINETWMVPFVFSADEVLMLHFSGASVRMSIDDVLLTGPTGVTNQIVNGAFNTDITSWTDASQAGGSVAWITGGYAGMKGDGTDFGILRQTLMIAGPDIGVEHFFQVTIEDGPVRLKIGSTAGDDDYVAEVRLDRGTYEFSVTPTGDVTIEFANEREFFVRVDGVFTSAGGVIGFGTRAFPDALPVLRWAQFADVLYYCADGEDTDEVPLQKITRHGNGRSWGSSRFLPEDGPFRTQNVSGITITASALNGDITLTASEGIFKQKHVDNRSIWRIASQGQVVTKAISGADDFTDAIRVVGKEDARTFGIIVEGTFVATVTLQFAFSADGPWNDQGATWVAPVSTNLTDGQDDQIIYYRVGVKAGGYGSGTVTCTLNYTGGSIQGIARVIGFTSATVVDAQVLKDFGSITASRDWWEGEWSDQRGWPTAVALNEGRLWLAGRDKIWGSISDEYNSFDDNREGDSGPISRSIAHGPVRIIHWLISMGRLMLGTADNSKNIAPALMDGNSVLGARSSSFDEPLTPTNFNIKTSNSKGVFVDRTGQRLYELLYDIEQQDYKGVDLSIFTPDFNEIGIKQIAVQMKPDIRIHCVRNDGTAGVLVYDRLENVICWIDVQSPNAAGVIENVAVLPGTVEDQVYYVVKRTINSATQRHICKWALESQAIGGTDNRIADSFKVYSGAPTTTPFTTELLHLRDETVEVWADGADIGTHVVSATGALTLVVAASDVIAGLGYTARFKGAKLGELNGIGMLERKKVNRIGFIARYMHHLGLRYGPDFDNLRGLPQTEKGKTIATDTVHTDYHEDNFPFGGDWSPDARICLQAAAPRPCTLLAALAEMESVEDEQE